MRRYHPRDYGEIAGWYEARGERAPDPSTLPVIGILCPGVACGFLMKTDTSVALIEGMATNPAAPLFARHRAIGRILDALVEEARIEGFRHVVGMARSNGIAKLAEGRQFRAIGRHAMLAREV